MTSTVMIARAPMRARETWKAVSTAVLNFCVTDASRPKAWTVSRASSVSPA